MAHKSPARLDNALGLPAYYFARPAEKDMGKLASTNLHQVSGQMAVVKGRDRYARLRDLAVFAISGSSVNLYK